MPCKLSLDVETVTKFKSATIYNGVGSGTKIIAEDCGIVIKYIGQQSRNELFIHNDEKSCFMDALAAAGWLKK